MQLARKSSYSIAGTLCCRLCLLHPLRHLRFDGLEIETRAALHRREVEERLQFFAYDLLNEDKTPELVLEPVEILLPAFLRSIVWPARALERIKP